MSRCVIVTGLPRTGTSIVAGIVHRLGVPMALPGGFSQPAEDTKHRYPEGNFEDREFRQLVLQATERDCDYAEELDTAEQAMQRFSHRKQLTEFTPKQYVEFGRWMRQRFSANPSFGVKLPAVWSVSQPIVAMLREYDVEPVVIFTGRSFDDAVSSLAEKRGTVYEPNAPCAWATAAQGYGEWRMARMQTKLTASGVKWRYIHFTGLTTDPVGATKDISEFIGVKNDPDAASVVHVDLHTMETL